MENFNEALMLMVVGMGTVFIMLLFIIYFSQLLIMIINKYIPVEVKAKSLKTSRGTSGVSPKVIAAISTAVNVASSGTMRVAKIDKK